MFTSQDLSEFATRLRTIRENLGMTLRDVVLESDLNVETLRKVEKALAVPRFETLERLSRVYKVDLISLLNQYKSAGPLLHFYSVIDYLITSNDKVAILSAIRDFHLYQTNPTEALIDPRDIEQLNLYFKGIDLDVRENRLRASSDMYEQALKVYSPEFQIENWQDFHYSPLELRILFSIASNYCVLEKQDLSIDILAFVMRQLDDSIYSSYFEKILYAKVLALLSYNYHMKDNHPLALQYADLGIEFCNRHMVMNYLPLLLSRKGMAMYLLGRRGYTKYLNQGITLLTIQGNDELAEQYKAVRDALGK